MSFLPFLATVNTVEVNPLVQITEQFGVNLPSLIAQILNFCLLAFVLYRFAIKPILATLDERQNKISGGLAYAEEMERKLKQAAIEVEDMLQKAHQEAQAIILEAQETAKNQTQSQIQATAHEIETMLHKAQEAAFQERKMLLDAAKKEIVQMVLSTVQLVLQKELTQDDRERFSARAAKELAS